MEKSNEKLQQLYTKFRAMDDQNLCSFDQFKGFVMEKSFIKKLNSVCGDESLDKEKRLASKEFLDIIYETNRIQ